MGAWIAATAAAVVLSWFGVRGVLHDAVVGHVPPLPPRHGAAAPPPPPEPTTSENPPTSSAPPTPTEVPRESTATSTPPPAAGETDARVRGFDLAGGRVVLAIHPDRARLVSAVPKPGFQVRTWRNAKWLRVDMVGPQHRSALFATWNGHPPTVRTVEH